MKQPLAWVTIVYAGGVIVGEFYPLYPAACAVGAGILAAMLFLSFWPGLAARRAGPVRFLAFLFFAGWANHSLRTVPLWSDDIRNLRLASAELATVRGTLTETPSQRVYLHGEQPSYRFTATVRTKLLRCNTAEWLAVSGKVLVLTPGMLPSQFFAGQEVEIAGVLSPPPGPLAEGLFDYRAYLRRQSIYYQLKADSSSDWTLLSGGTQAPVSDRFLAWAQKALARGLPTHDESLDMLWAMTLGWKTVDNQVYEPFMQSGTMHIFAISGLHIALIAGIFLALLRVLQLPRLCCGLVVVPLIWFYTGATGWQPSAVRSTIMMTIVVSGWALCRPSNLLNSLAGSALVILLWDPAQLFGASFQLSFFVVLSIALFMPRFQHICEELLKTDPLLPQCLVPGWKRILLRPLRWLATSVAISVASWLGSLPLTAYYFHLFSPVTLLANIVVVPLSTGALAANLASLITSPWLPAAAELFNHAAWFFMYLMIQVSTLSILLPGAYSYVHAPTIPAMVLFYVAVIGLLAGKTNPGGKWGGNARRLLLGMAAISGSGILYFWPAPTTSATLSVLPLAGGFAVHANHPGLGRDLLVDCGNSEAVHFITTPFLRARGTDHLPRLLLTHGDIRHTGGACLLAQNFRIDRTFASPVRFRSSAYRQAIKTFSESARPLANLSRGSMLGPWTVLHPDGGDHFPRADDNALVLVAELHGIRVLLLSDLGPGGQNALLERDPDLRADIVITGLPAVGEPLSPALLERLQPGLIIIADSEFPANERASARLRDRLSQTSIPILYTRFSGSTTLELQHRTWNFRTMRAGPPRDQPGK